MIFCSLSLQAEKQTTMDQFVVPGGSQNRGIKSKRVKRVVLRMLDREKELEKELPQKVGKRKRGGPCLSSSGSDSDSDDVGDENSGSSGKSSSKEESPATTLVVKPPRKRKIASRGRGRK